MIYIIPNQMLSGIKCGKLNNFSIGDKDIFNLTPGTSNSYDESSFNQCLTAFKKLGFSMSHQNEIFRVRN